MEKQKIISFKMQYLLSLIPYMGVFVVCFCSFYNLRKIKKQSNIFMLGYLFAVSFMCIAFISIVVVIAQNFLLSNLTAYSIAILVGMYVAALIAGIFGVWFQKQRIKKIERAENNAYFN